MGYASERQVLDAARDLAYKENGALVRTNGLWHVLMFLRHRACHSEASAFTFESYDLAQAAFDLNGVKLPILDDSRNVYFEPGATQGNSFQKLFRHREGPRQTYLNRIYTGLVGGGPRQPELFQATRNSLPTTINLAPQWIPKLRALADNQLVLDQRLHSLITWIFRYGIPTTSQRTAHIATHSGNGRLTRDNSVVCGQIPVDLESLRAELLRYFALTPSDLAILMPELHSIRPEEWVSPAPIAFDLSTKLGEPAGVVESPAYADDISSLKDEFLAAAVDGAGLYIAPRLVMRLCSALLSKRFLILTGLAGSGKTLIAQAFARWISPDSFAVDPFAPGSLIHSDSFTYFVHSSDTLAVEFWDSEKEENANKVTLPRAIIEEWADYIRENNISKETFVPEMREVIKSRSMFSDQLHSFETHLEAAAFASLDTSAVLPIGDCYVLVPVGADWSGSDNILGYPDGLDKESYFTRTTLEIILHAQAHRDVPHFLILDEMNLSHVERYFAEVLSAIESNEFIVLHHDNERTANGKSIPHRINLPTNLFIVGTVNVDETTYMFSPKVLDRANVIEFRMDRSELASFLASPGKPDLRSLEGKGVALGSAFVSAAQGAVSIPSDAEGAFEEELLLFFEVMRAHGAEFGYRVAHESARFIHFYKLLGNYPDDGTWFFEAFDCVVVQKFLPKLHGSRAKLGPLLKILWFLCVNDMAGRGVNPLEAAMAAAGSTLKNFEPVTTIPPAAPYPVSAEKIARMWRLLKDNGFTSFAEA